MGTFAPSDQKPSTVALFCLWIIWMFLFIALFFTGRWFKGTSESPDDEKGESTEQGNTVKIKETRFHRTFRDTRDGILLLLVAVFISFAGNANSSATTALAWVFTGFWFIVLILDLLIDSRIIQNVFRTIAILVLFALIITAYSTAIGHFNAVQN